MEVNFNMKKKRNLINAPLLMFEKVDIDDYNIWSDLYLFTVATYIIFNLLFSLIMLILSLVLNHFEINFGLLYMWLSYAIVLFISFLHYLIPGLVSLRKMDTKNKFGKRFIKVYLLTILVCFIAFELGLFWALVK